MYCLRGLLLIPPLLLKVDCQIWRVCLSAAVDINKAHQKHEQGWRILRVGKPRSPHCSLHVKPKCEAKIVKVSRQNCEGGTSQRWTLRWRERTRCVQNTKCMHVYTLPHCMHHREAAWNGQIRVHVVSEQRPGRMQLQSRAICADVGLINAALREGRARSTGWYLRRMGRQKEARGTGIVLTIWSLRSTKRLSVRSVTVSPLFGFM